MSDSESTPAIGDVLDDGPTVDDVLKAIEEIELPPLSDEPDGDEPVLTPNRDQAFTNCGSLQSLDVMQR